jgi:hypothetical protein
MPLHYPTENKIIHSEQRLTNCNLDQQYAIDPSLEDSGAQAQARTMEQAYNGDNDVISQFMKTPHSFDSQGQHFVMTFNDEQTQDDGGAGEARKKKGSASSIANDNELRKLFAANKDRDLNDVAASVLANERGPKSEKTKQIFAMNWSDSISEIDYGVRRLIFYCRLNSTCRRGNTSVPRSRVYTDYATRCGNERVSPLNPASFGKLVRIIFPSIQTRRLGMRGESKYHYVDLMLIDDPPKVHNGEHFQDSGDVVGATDSSVLRWYVNPYYGVALFVFLPTSDSGPQLQGPISS